MRIGLISDTHGYLDAKIPELFAGVDQILHAGDIGTMAILHALEEIAPVTAVLGNNDVDFALPSTSLVRLKGLKILMHHIVDPARPEGTILRRISRDQPDIVVFGHSHRYFCQAQGPILFINPGYSGRPRLQLDRSVAILDLSQDTPKVDRLSLA